MMHKILLINKSLVVGGIERVLINQYHTLKERGYRVDILLFQDIIEFDFQKIEDIIYYDTLKSLKHFLVKNQYDMIICHAQSERICKKVKATHMKNILFVIHGMQSDRLLGGTFLASFIRKKRIQNLYKNQNLVSVSQAVKNDIEAIGVSAKSHQVIYNPLDIKSILEKSLEQIEEHFTKPYLIWVGNISTVKNLPLLIELYRHVAHMYDLVIIGDGNQDIIHKLNEKITLYQLSKKVYFLNRKTNPFPYMKKAKALLITSKNEGLGMVVIESLLLGTPVFGVDVPAIRELLLEYFPFGLLKTSACEESGKQILQNINQEVEIHKVAKMFSAEVSNEKYLSYSQLP